MCLGALADIAPDVASSLAREGDTLLLCSDGLWGQIDMSALIAELDEKPLTPELLHKWIDKARVSNSESGDNITLVAARFINKPRLLSSLLLAITSLFKK